MFLQRWPQASGGRDLGGVDWSKYHPTVARLLGVQPAEPAEGTPLILPEE